MPSGGLALGGIVLVAVTCAFGMIAYGLRQVMLAAEAVEHLDRAIEPEAAAARKLVRRRSVLQRFWLVPWIIGAVIFVVTFFILGWSDVVCIAMSLILTMFGVQLEGWFYEYRRARLEMALADAIDLMVTGLQAGAGVVGALEASITEARGEMKHLLEEVVGRIRLGDSPQQVFATFIERVPLESFRLFAMSLSVHWEVGGSLAPVLANVGRTVRDRIEISRRTRAMTTQSRLSVFLVLGATYLIAWALFRLNPDRIGSFLSIRTGQVLVAGAMVLQAIGMTWIASLSKPKF